MKNSPLAKYYIKEPRIESPSVGGKTIKEQACVEKLKEGGCNLSVQQP